MADTSTSHAKTPQSYKFMKPGVSKGPFLISSDEEEEDSESDDNTRNNEKEEKGKSHAKEDGSGPENEEHAMQEDDVKNRNLSRTTAMAQAPAPSSNTAAKKQRRPTEMAAALYGGPDDPKWNDVEEQVWNKVVRRGTPPLKAGGGTFSRVTESRTPDARLWRKTKATGLVPPRKLAAAEHPKKNDRDRGAKDPQWDGPASGALRDMNRRKFQKFQEARNLRSTPPITGKWRGEGATGVFDGGDSLEGDGDSIAMNVDQSSRASSPNALHVVSDEEELPTQPSKASSQAKKFTKQTVFPTSSSTASDTSDASSNEDFEQEQELAQIREKAKERRMQRLNEKSSAAKVDNAEAERAKPPLPDTPSKQTNKKSKKKKKDAQPPVTFSIISRPVFRVDDTTGHLSVSGAVVSARQVLASKSIREKNREALRSASTRAKPKESVNDRINQLLGTTKESAKESEEAAAEAEEPMVSVEPEVVAPKVSQRDIQVGDFFREAGSVEKPAAEAESSGTGKKRPREVLTPLGDRRFRHVRMEEKRLDEEEKKRGRSASGR
ncbi:hypothetical protein NA57DRAFT_71922 [Rhizodiscina lignyota]|uniref:Uncharacterized protein n=1 Tax=Rhizodiscina lignyota TaxID=1504668 RepID=A0A9P4IPB6_9PEZI|nr:hypothetical protein NA57DRAFT_71922 [Rhizodiscina lignyota]